MIVEAGVEPASPGYEPGDFPLVYPTGHPFSRVMGGGDLDWDLYERR